MTEEQPAPVDGFFSRFFKDPEFKRRAAFLRRVVLFQGLVGRDMGLLIQSLFEKTYREGELLFDEGEIGRALFIVETGCVDLFKRGPDGQPQVLATTGAGDFFGEMALLEELPRSAGAIARTDTRVHLLYKTKLYRLVRSRPRAGLLILEELAKLLSARLRSTSQRLIAGDIEITVDQQ